MSILAMFASGAISWLLALVTGAALLVGIAALVWSRIRPLPYRHVAAGLAGLLLFIAGWAGHASDQRGRMERQALIAANRALVKEAASERAKVAALARDAELASAHAAAAEAKARALEDLIAQTPDTPALDADTSARVRGLWR